MWIMCDIAEKPIVGNITLFCKCFVFIEHSSERLQAAARINASILSLSLRHG